MSLFFRWPGLLFAWRLVFPPLVPPPPPVLRRSLAAPAVDGGERARGAGGRTGNAQARLCERPTLRSHEASAAAQQSASGEDRAAFPRRRGLLSACELGDSGAKSCGAPVAARCRAAVEWRRPGIQPAGESEKVVSGGASAKRLMVAGDRRTASSTGGGGGRGAARLAPSRRAPQSSTSRKVAADGGCGGAPFGGAADALPARREADRCE